MVCMIVLKPTQHLHHVCILICHVCDVRIIPKGCKIMMRLSLVDSRNMAILIGTLDV